MDIPRFSRIWMSPLSPSESSSRSPATGAPCALNVKVYRIQIPEGRQLQATISHVRDVKHHILQEFALDAKVVLLHIGRSLIGILRLSRHSREVDTGEIDEARRYSVLKPEDRIGRAQRSTAGDVRVGQDDVRRIESQQPFAAQPVGMVVEQAVCASKNRLGCQRVGESEARCKIVLVRLDQRLLLQRSILSRDELSRGRVEVRPL